MHRLTGTLLRLYGALLVCAAVAKVGEPTPSQDLLRAIVEDHVQLAWWVLVVVELTVGAVGILIPHSWWVRLGLSVVATAMLLAQVSGLLPTGVQECGCFGPLHVDSSSRVALGVASFASVVASWVWCPAQRPTPWERIAAAGVLTGCLAAVWSAGSASGETDLRHLCQGAGGSGCVLVVGSRGCSHCDQALQILAPASADWHVQLVVPELDDGGEPKQDAVLVVGESEWLRLVRGSVPTIWVVPRDGPAKAFVSASLARRDLDERRSTR